MRRLNKFIPAILLLFLSLFSNAQQPERKVTNQSFSMFSYVNQFSISPKISILNDFQERNFVKPLKQSQINIRSQLSYKFKENWTVATGIAYYRSSPSNPYSFSKLVVPEIRLNLDLNYEQHVHAFNLGNRFRIEERSIHKNLNDSLISGSNLRTRLSYTFSFEYYLSKSKDVHGLMLKASEGIYIYTNKKFDQNRFYTGLNYQLENRLSLELGYIKSYQQLSSGHRYYNRDMASLKVNHQIKRKSNQHIEQKSIKN